MQFNEKNPLSEKEQAKLHSFSCISCYLGIIIFISFRSTFTREEKQKSLSCCACSSPCSQNRFPGVSHPCEFPCRAKSPLLEYWTHEIHLSCASPSFTLSSEKNLPEALPKLFFSYHSLPETRIFSTTGDKAWCISFPGCCLRYKIHIPNTNHAGTSNWVFLPL